MYQLIQEALRLGVRVRLAHIPDGRLGYYDDDDNEIIVDLGLHMLQIKATLAHELGHAYYCHKCGNLTHERQARRYAARLLIDPQQYERAERIDPTPSAIGDELGVFEDVVRDYQHYWLNCQEERPIQITTFT